MRLSHFFVAARPYYKVVVSHDPYSFWLWTHPDRTKEDEGFFVRFLKPGDVVIDAGANIGTLTLTASRVVGSGGHIFSFEPHPETFAFLKRNCSYNKCSNVELFQKGVGNTVTEARMINEYVKDINHIDPSGSISVSLVTLDSVIPKEIKTTLLKLDIEGYELFALEGASKILENTEAVYVESSPKNFRRFNYSQADIVKFLEMRGFEVHIIHSDFTLERIDTTYVTKQKYENFLALRNKDFYYTRMGM